MAIATPSKEPVIGMNLETSITALLTLAIYSFLAGDNPIYRFAEHLLVGLTLGYSLVITVSSIIMPEVISPLATGEWQAAFPLLLGSMMFLRLVPRARGWSQIPMAIIIGCGAGLALPAMLKARVVQQLGATIEGVGSVDGILILIGVATTLVYFIFTRRDSGAAGFTSRIGRVFMMVFFGATFAYTVMSRMTLLIGRLEFLLGDWLGLLG